MSDLQTLRSDIASTQIIIRNTLGSNPTANITREVNRLATLLVSGGVAYADVGGKMIDMKELRRSLRWLGVLLNRVKNQSVYLVWRSGRDIIGGRTASLQRDYDNFVKILLSISDTIYQVSGDLQGELGVTVEALDNSPR